MLEKMGHTEVGSSAGPKSWPSEADQGRLVVLVVDDYADFRQTLCQSIELGGHRVLAASTGDEALDLMSDEAVGVIITDISMPGLNGVELIRQVRKRSTHGKPRIIVMTGQGRLKPDVKSALTTLGVTTFLTKPFQMNELIEALAGS